MENGMKNILIVVLIAAFVNGFLYPQEKKDKIPNREKKESLVGYLVDKNCGRGMVMNDVKKSDAKAAKHTRECGLDDACKSAGFGLVAGGKFFKFDDAGDKKAVEYLTASKKEDHIKVSVVYTMDGEKMNVESIKDYSAKIKAVK